MISFFKDDDKLVLRYTPEFASSNNWIREAIKTKGFVKLKKTFYYENEDILNNSEFQDDTEVDDYDDLEMEHTTFFGFAELVGDYYKVKRGILIDHFDVFIHKDVRLNTNFFVANSDVSVF